MSKRFQLGDRVIRPIDNAKGWVIGHNTEGGNLVSWDDYRFVDSYESDDKLIYTKPLQSSIDML